MIRQERPDDAFIGEESGTHGHGRRRWLIDAVDGAGAGPSPGRGDGLATDVDPVGVQADQPLQRRQSGAGEDYRDAPPVDGRPTRGRVGDQGKRSRVGCTSTGMPVPTSMISSPANSSGDDGSFRRLAIGARELPQFSVLTGHELVVDAMMLVGADGSVPGLGNVDPHGYVRLHEAAVRGDWAAARSEQDHLVALFDIVRAARPGTVSATAAGLGAFKTALMLRGLVTTNVMSPPTRRLDAAETETIAACLDRAGLSRV
ncbi:dihydrodipicolinate synthase family protein [Streptomyces sp. BE133]|uniref:dihydrodipicolinate synthase family protein n=1 Tax=Streptomyces sp. BE133 TaxID=3002523 RepID=UPI002E75B25F|nr:dihydrodipicolinate synthase family protein [Streptomyces sp. BE133]MEE1809249.1 dihydrodipicolinate synthase family protein [Streptomyces sp. BE133]